MKFENFSQDEKMKGKERRKENREIEEGRREGGKGGRKERRIPAGMRDILQSL